jgi:hypothetical protein
VTDDPIENRRKNGGRFQPGNTANPNGRPKGSRNRSTLILGELVDSAGPKLIRRAIKMAMDGDSQIMRALLPLLLSPRRERAIAFELPPIETAADALAASKTILAGAANGAITPAEAAELGRLLELNAKLYELNELEERINSLERERGLGTPGSAVQ